MALVLRREDGGPFGRGQSVTTESSVLAIPTQPKTYRSRTEVKKSRPRSSKGLRPREENKSNIKCGTVLGKTRSIRRVKQRGSGLRPRRPKGQKVAGDLGKRFGKRRRSAILVHGRPGGQESWMDGRGREDTVFEVGEGGTRQERFSFDEVKGKT